MLLRVGRVVKPHGLRGEVAVALSTDEPHQRFAAGSTVVLEGRTRLVAAARPMGERWLVQLDGIGDRDQAEALRGQWLWAEVSIADDAGGRGDAEHVHDAVLIGMDVLTGAGELVGRVRGVQHNPSQDLLSVGLPDGSTVLVPFVEAMVVEVDVDSRRLVIDPPAGLLDPDKAV